MNKKKKKYKLKKKRILVTILALTVTIILLFNFNTIKEYIKLKTLSYENESIKLIHNNDLEIKKYSETLDKIINTEYFNKNYLDYYLDIEYNNYDNYFQNINSLIKIGYNATEINTIYKKANDSINIILENNYNKDILIILNSKYYKKDNLERYLNYNKENIVLNVNMNLDYDFYNHDILIDNIDNLVIVNKYYKLPSNYIPSLVKLSNKYAINNYQELNKDALEAFIQMCEEGKKENIYIYAGSTYRSYNYQNNLYNNRVKNEGLEYADKTAARAGYSEHQTGLAIDIINKNFDYLDETDKEYEWLINNSYKYGYILRYPKDKENITGYSYEPWHFRYISIDIATYLYENNLTYEEYIGMNK